jgi:hypothetical protein
MFNICVDAPDAYLDYVPEDLSFNEQESIVEIIVEKILGFENALAEYDENDTEAFNKKKDSRLDILFQCQTLLENLNNHPQDQKQNYSHYLAQLAMGFLQVDSPPPKV